MDLDRHIWRVWAGYLQQWGVSEWVASFLEAAGALTILGAQLMYIGRPLLRHTLPDEHLCALERVLEDTGYNQDFVRFLREAPTQ